ncbi:MAG TPA: prenyltransferase/squalene oxidase repeat-containing protein [Solirubrobacterales bacterium]|jgi:energy-coupling factor transport system substrate-specific component|nr:prenyltransferase/squalene oxidase repeat-containing protein [Solirubrobacterales bacterium]
MSWQLTSFVILGLVLLGGFVWYERSRPPSQVVALVAALAALAIVGRIAFAAFPNVKPTTDIVIFAGYALGGAPGFAVGALAGLVSNFWFGQGPWTPWQMAAWGLCGVLGALLALGARNASRFVLAGVCGIAGILYGALMNFSLMATYGGDLSWKHFWVLEGRAVPFEIAHVLGNVVLALVAGPAMVRMLVRFRQRFEWQRRGTKESFGGSGGKWGGALRGGIALLLVAMAAALAAPAAQASDVSRAADWLASQQRPSGGFAADSGREAGAEMTSWAMLALAAAGRNPLDVTAAGKSPVDFLRSHAAEIKDAGDVARTILALEAAGVDSREFAGENFVDRLLAQRRQSGSYQGWPATSAYAVLALRAAGANDATAKTVEWLRKVQGKDGGWGNLPGDASTPEITGAVLQVLSPGSEASDRALAYLRKAKRPNGGFAPANNLAANAQATAWASEGLLAADKDPAGFGTGKSSLAYLRDLQADDGHFLQAPGQESSPVWVTADAIVPLSSHFLPISAPPREPKPKPASPPNSSSPDYSGGLPSSSVPPPDPGESPLETLERFEDSPTGESPAGQPASPGGRGKGVKPSGGSIGSPLPQGSPVSPAPAPETPLLPSDAAGEPASESTDDSSSTAGAILLGLLSGCILFGLGLAGRRGWMRWRYGL